MKSNIEASHKLFVTLIACPSDVQRAKCFRLIVLLVPCVQSKCAGNKAVQYSTVVWFFSSFLWEASSSVRPTQWVEVVTELNRQLHYIYQRIINRIFTKLHP